ncbi:excalibur calcium-binding domain-containing protein [Rothia mucilaginosa]|uniref:excalibur calcium-binding domain-containing protein n=1 Tax=Rothia mucilaginosa TaxID=43675 RepID=UPI001EFA0E7F|nr:MULTISPECIES: excalibur calcium-binding domain-containing protein [Rothia]MDU2572142.1 excalibur calcium-binding domain-containing protein [Rothia mucilaginosa]
MPTQEAPAREAPAQSSVYYKNCAEARAAGAAPIHRGEPGYRAELDRDDDGIACEWTGKTKK